LLSVFDSARSDDQHETIAADVRAADLDVRADRGILQAAQAQVRVGRGLGRRDGRRRRRGTQGRFGLGDLDRRRGRHILLGAPWIAADHLEVVRVRAHFLQRRDDARIRHVAVEVDVEEVLPR
jgi:hypothetical protein